MTNLQIPVNLFSIGIDPSFIAYIFAKEKDFSCSLDSARNLQEAEKKTATSLYDIYLIDLEICQDELVPFIKNIKHIAPTALIALISSAGKIKNEIQELVNEKLIDAILQKPLSPQEIDELFSHIKEEKTKLQTQAWLVNPEASLPLVYMVDSDTHFLTLLKKIQENFPFQLEIESDIKNVIERIKNPSFNPSMFIAQESFPGTHITAFDLIDEQKNKTSHPFISVVILNQNYANGQLEARLQAMQKGIDYVFHKPLYAENFLKSIKGILEANASLNLKVLMLDDDVDFCSMISDILKETGVSFRSIHSGKDLFPTLEEYKPDLLLLDLMLPEYDGLNLLKTLRQDTSYTHLNIIIITGADESSTKLSAYSAKADDIVYKPIDPLVFQQRILNFAKKTLREEKDDPEKSNLKGLITEIHRTLNQAKSYLCLFEIDQFADWVIKNGQIKAHELLVSIENQLLLESNYFNIGPAKYGLIFVEQAASDIALKMETLLLQLAKRETLCPISFNCSLSLLSKTFGNAEQNLKRGEAALQEASLKENALVKMNVLEEINRDSQKEVVLIDGDTQLLEILKNSFLSHGVKVTTFTEGSHALDNLLKRSAYDLPALIIAERKLIDMDGIDILSDLKAHFHKVIPFYVLTFYAADKDILKGIKLGALEYFTKPFNTSILLEKALAVVG